MRPPAQTWGTLQNQFIRTDIIADAIDVTHAFIQDGHDPDVAIRETTPID